ncbi:hypothetical protein ACLOJK_010172 [Asimina triloba]
MGPWTTEQLAFNRGSCQFIKPDISRTRKTRITDIIRKPWEKKTEAMASRPLKRRRNEEEEGGERGEGHSSPRKDSTSPLVVFAHGAGAPSSSDWMIRWKELLRNAVNAVEVVTFDYPCESITCFWFSASLIPNISGGKRKAPPKAEKLVEFHSDIVRRATEKHPGHPLILVGKSMGSRVSCMVAAQDDIHPSAIVCLGYPLKSSDFVVKCIA